MRTFLTSWVGIQAEPTSFPRTSVSQAQATAPALSHPFSIWDPPNPCLPFTVERGRLLPPPHTFSNHHLKAGMVEIVTSHHNDIEKMKRKLGRAAGSNPRSDQQIWRQPEGCCYQHPRCNLLLLCPLSKALNPLKSFYCMAADPVPPTI